MVSPSRVMFLRVMMVYDFLLAQSIMLHWQNNNDNKLWKSNFVIPRINRNCSIFI